MKNIFTIGYEGKSFEEFIEVLKKNKINALIDVRIRAGSRKKGFSKTFLSNYLGESDIIYEHHKQLGTPKYLMEVMKNEGHYEMEAYDKFISERPELIEDFVENCKYENICLMCYELDYNDCHRSVVANKISKIIPIPIKHL